MNYIDVKKYNFGDYYSEKETALFFDRIGLDCVALNPKIPTETGIDLGEIDGIFIDDKHELIFVYDDSVHKNDVNKKISGWFNKWTFTDNKNKLLDELKLPDFYRIVILYIDKIKTSDKKGDLEPIKSSLKENCKVLFKDDFTYFDGLSQDIKKWTKNDLYHFLGIKLKDSIRKTKKVIQFYVGDTPAFVFSDRVENILEYSYVYRRRDEIDSIGYQRALDKKRIDTISKLILDGKLNSFPNSILINCLENIEGKIASKEECPKELEISLPSNFSSCRIVDGQHRVMSFAKTNDSIQRKYSLPIVLFSNMNFNDEIKTFIDINDNQQSIDKNLTLSLKAKLNWPKGSKEQLQKIAFLIISELTKKNASINKRIFKGYAGESKKYGNDNKLTTLSITNVLLKNKIVHKNGGVIQKNENDVNTATELINNFFKELISKDGANQSYYYSNRGFNLIIKYIGIIHLNIENKTFKKELTFKKLQETFIEEVPKLITKLKKDYGAAGEKNSFEMVCIEVEKKLDIIIEKDLRKLKLQRLPVLELSNETLVAKQ